MPSLADGNAASAVIPKLCMFLVCAPLDHLPPTVVRRFEAFAKRFAVAYFPLRVDAGPSAENADRHPLALF